MTNRIRYVVLTKDEYDDKNSRARNAKLSRRLASDRRNIRKISKIELAKVGNYHAWWATIETA